jgi:hypothetical protein
VGLIIRFDWISPEMATTPSRLATKFAYSLGSENPSDPP